MPSKINIIVGVRYLRNPKIPGGRAILSSSLLQEIWANAHERHESL